MSKKVVVFGAGAIGGQLGARMHEAGHDVTIVEPWEPQLSAIRAQGLTIRTGDAEATYRPPAIAPAELSGLGGPIDVLFLSVKSFDTLEALATVRPYLAPDALVVSTQNSINEELIVPVMGPERVLGAVILVNAVLLEPGHITATSSVSRATVSLELPGAYVGEFGEPAGEKAREVTVIMDSALKAEPIDDLLRERWSKLANNTMLNPVSGLSGLRSGPMLAHPVARRVCISVAAEVMRVAEAEGHPLEVLMGDYSAEDVYATAEGRSDVVERGLAERAGRVGADATTSLLQDVLRGRRTEVDYFSGLVSKKGAAHGIPTPFCDVLTELVHRVEAGTLTPSPEALGEVLELVGR